MAITKKDLEIEVARLNKKYCKNTKHELRVAGAYGGYQVQLTGKRMKNGKGYRGMGSGCANVTYGYGSARSTLADLFKSEANGTIRNIVKHHEKYY